jgi:hypothetical protein
VDFDAEFRSSDLEPAKINTNTMGTAYLSALSALAGSAVGSLTSGVTTWLSQRFQARAGHLAREMSRWDGLYKDFIVSASKAYGGALTSKEPNIAELVDI